MDRLRLRLITLLSGFCIFLLRPTSSQEFVFPPSTVILFPGETSAIFECVINPSAIIISWEVNTARYGLDELFKGHLPGHNVSGTNITVSVPMNGTKYVCVIPAVPPNPTISSNPAFLYIATAPDMIGNVMIDLNTVNVDNNNVSFVLNWDEPFANFDPIVNCTITINCTDAQCPTVFTVTTTSASVDFITDLSTMTPLSVTASNTFGTSEPAIVIVVVPDEVDMVDIMCGPVDLINQCTVTWNALVADPSVVAAPIYYIVSYSGDNITDSSVHVNTSMVTIDLPAVDSVVNVTVTATNAFGSGPASHISVDEIMASSLINTNSVFNFDPDNMMNTYSLVVTCEINPTSSAEYCEVIARNDDVTIRSSAPITSDMVEVTLNSLECKKTYTVAAGGVDNATELVGPQIVRETVTASACSVSCTTSSIAIDTATITIPTTTITPTIGPCNIATTTVMTPTITITPTPDTEEPAFIITGWYQISGNNVQVFFNSTVPATFQCKLDKDSPVTCVSGYIFRAVSVGKHRIQLIARLDSNRKIKKVLKLKPFTIQEPTTTSPPPPLPPKVTASANIFNVCSVRLNLSANVAATFRCRVNGGRWKTCSDGYIVSDLPPAIIEIEIEASAVQDPGVKTVVTPTVNLMGQACSVLEINHPICSPLVVGNNFTFTFNANKANAEYLCSLNNKQHTSCNEGSVTYSNLKKNRDQLLTITASTCNGETASKNFSFSSKFSSRFCKVYICGDGVVTSDSSAMATFLSDDPDAIFKCKLNGKRIHPCTSPLQLSDLSPGTYALEIKPECASKASGGKFSTTFSI